MNTEALQIAKLEGEVEALKAVINDLVKALIEDKPIYNMEVKSEPLIDMPWRVTYGPSCTDDEPDFTYFSSTGGEADNAPSE